MRTPTPQRCLRCGQPLPAPILGGHCPRCLAAVSLHTARTGEPERAASENLPRSLGDYELLAEVARGGMGVVYRARQANLNREVALKMVLAGPFASRAALDRLRAEALAAASLQHPNIVSIHEVGEAEGQPFFTMDFIEGTNLADWVRAGPLPAEQAARYVEQIARAIHYAHQRGVLHRDLKPSNVLIDTLDQPRITDFGLAKRLASDFELRTSRLTLTGQTLGSPNYMAPEQASPKHGVVSVRSDVYSLGALLYHLITGRAPFAAGTMAETLQQVLSRDPLPPRALNPSVPADLETICLKCLEKEPARRFVSAQAVAADLSRFLRDEPITARPAGRCEKAGRWCRRNPALALALTAFALAFVLGLSGVLLEWCRAAQSERTMRLNLYAADMMAASQALDRGDLGLARRLLEAYQPAGKSEIRSPQSEGKTVSHRGTGAPSTRHHQPSTDLRGFEWRYLWQLCRGQQRATLVGHTLIVTCVAFSPDGLVLASGSHDGTVRLWNPRDAKPLATIHAHDGAVWTAAFSPEGDLLVTGGSDGKVRVWKLSSREPLAALDGQQAALARTGSVMAVVGASSLFWEPAGLVSLWDYRTQRKLLELPGAGKQVAFSPDGKTLAVTGWHRGLRLWDVSSGQMRRALDSDSQLRSPTFSPTGPELAAGSRSAAFVWDLAHPGKPATLPHTLTVWAATFSPDGRTLVTAASDRGVRLWEAASLTLRGVLWGHSDEVWCAAFSPDGNTLATGGKDLTVRLWSPVIGPAPAALPHTAFERPFFSPAGARLVTSTSTNDQPQSVVWDVPLRTPLAVSRDAALVGFTADGQNLLRLATHGPGLEVWSAETQTTSKVIPLRVPPGDWPFRRIGFAPTWKSMFGIATNGDVGVFDTTTGKRRGGFHWSPPKGVAVASAKIRCAVLSPDEIHLAISFEEENAARLYEWATGRETQLEGHRDFVSGLAFSPDGRLLATGSVDAAIKLWDVATGGELATLAGHMEEASDVAFSPDGRTLASIGAQSTLKLWHVATRREVMSREFPRAGFHLAFSPDGRHLALTLGHSRGNEAVGLLSPPTLDEIARPPR